MDWVISVVTRAVAYRNPAGREQEQRREYTHPCAYSLTPFAGQTIRWFDDSRHVTPPL
jgi:hypothetical protein